MNAAEISKLSNDVLVGSLSSWFGQERKTSHVVLLHIREIWRRKAYAEYGYSSLFEMLVKYFHQSESAANQRLKALQLMHDVPDVEEKFVSGEVSLSVLAMAQRQILREEKIIGVKVSKEKKAEIVERIVGKTQAEAEVELFAALPAAASMPETFERRVSAEATRLGLTISEELRQKIEQLQNAWGAVDPNMDIVQVLERAVDIALTKTGKTSPQRFAESAKLCVTPPGKRPNYYRKALDRELWRRAQSRCEFVSEKTGQRCECRFGLERDHILPLALGGSNELDNLRLYCRTHNLYRAREQFGLAAAR